jgi:hypothetical protein
MLLRITCSTRDVAATTFFLSFLANALASTACNQSWTTVQLVIQFRFSNFLYEPVYITLERYLSCHGQSIGEKRRSKPELAADLEAGHDGWSMAGSQGRRQGDTEGHCHNPCEQ